MNTTFTRTASACLCVGFAFLCLLAPGARAGEIHEAIRKNDIRRVSALLETDATNAVQSTIGSGVTPIHLAAVLNRKDIVELLIWYGADPNAATASGFTPLHWAASRDAADAALLLIQNGADVRARAEKGITPLHWAASKNATNVVKLLLVANAGLTNRTDSGLTPLHWAAMGKADEAEFVLAYGAATEQMAKEPPEPTGDEPQSPESTTEPVPPGTPPASLVPDIGPRPAYGQSLMVDIGRGETLTFAWIEVLGLWVGKHEVTNGQFRRYRPSHDSLHREGLSLNERDQPVVRVTWADAESFCTWLNLHYSDRLPLGCRFRLPTEAEWITVARCGTDRKYPWGNRWPPAYGNYSDLSARRSLTGWRGIRGYDDGFPVACPVAASGTNDWGLCGVGGNVWEWCSDWFDRDFKYKVRKGACWDYDQRPSLEIGMRGFDRPDARYDTIGFRLVASRPNP